jgi:hypothetical protein
MWRLIVRFDLAEHAEVRGFIVIAALVRKRLRSWSMSWPLHLAPAESAEVIAAGQVSDDDLLRSRGG